MSTEVFPVLPGLTYSVVKAPNFATRMQRSISGRELRVVDYYNPIWMFTLVYSVLHDEAFWSYTPPSTPLRIMMDFLLRRQGADDVFLFDDPTDDRVTGQSIGTGDGTTVAFQLVRQLIPGGFAEYITAPNVVSAVYLNGVLDSPANYSVNADTGVVTFTSAPGSGVAITADFTYYFRVRFTADSLDFEQFMHNLWELKRLRLTSVVL